MTTMDSCSVGIEITDDEVVDVLPDLPENLALQMARSLIRSSYQDQLITLMVDIGASPEFHQMLEQMISGEMLVREFGGYCYMAGRLSMAMAEKP